MARWAGWLLAVKNHFITWPNACGILDRFGVDIGDSLAVLNFGNDELAHELIAAGDEQFGIHVDSSILAHVDYAKGPVWINCGDAALLGEELYFLGPFCLRLCEAGDRGTIF